MKHTKSLADYLREIHIKAVDSGIEEVTIPVNILDEIVNKFDTIEGLLYNAKNVLTEAIYVEEVKR